MTGPSLTLDSIFLTTRHVSLIARSILQPRTSRKLLDLNRYVCLFEKVSKPLCATVKVLVTIGVKLLVDACIYLSRVWDRKGIVAFYVLVDVRPVSLHFWLVIALVRHLVRIQLLWRYPIFRVRSDHDCFRIYVNLVFPGIYWSLRNHLVIHEIAWKLPAISGGPVGNSLNVLEGSCLWPICQFRDVQFLQTIHSRTSHVIHDVILQFKRPVFGSRFPRSDAGSRLHCHSLKQSFCNWRNSQGADCQCSRRLSE